MDVDSDATIAGFVLQQHFSALIESFVHHTNASLRFTALQLIGTHLRQGMVCPLDIISVLIALLGKLLLGLSSLKDLCYVRFISYVLGDLEPRIRSTAMELLLAENEHHPTFLENRLLQGIEASCEFQIRVFGAIAPTDVSLANFNQEESKPDLQDGTSLSIFAELYRSCIRPHKKRRVDFLSHMVRRSGQLLVHIRESADKNKQILPIAGGGKRLGNMIVMVRYLTSFA